MAVGTFNLLRTFESLPSQRHLHATSQIADLCVAVSDLRCCTSQPTTCLIILDSWLNEFTTLSIITMASVNTLPSSNTTSPTSTLDILHEEEGGGMEVSSRLLPTNVHTSSSRRSNLIKKKTIIVNKGEKDVVGITLEEDTFTMMMAADLKENKISWWLGVLCFVTQCSLISLV